MVYHIRICDQRDSFEFNLNPTSGLLPQNQIPNTFEIYVLIMGEQVIESDEAKRTYRVLKDVCESIQIEGSGIEDEEWLKKSLEVLFVTKPINKDEPFDVDRFVTPKDSVNGSDFHVSSYKFSARDTTVGGLYKIELLAFNTTTDYYYDLKATVHQTEPHLTIKSCVLDSVEDINCR